MGDHRSYKKRKNKNDKKAGDNFNDDHEAIIDFNPDDVESGEEVPGIREINKHARRKKKKKKEHITQDFNPDDYEEG